MLENLMTYLTVKNKQEVNKIAKAFTKIEGFLREEEVKENVKILHYREGKIELFTDSIVRYLTITANFKYSNYPKFKKAINEIKEDV